MLIVELRVVTGESTVLADVQLASSLFVAVDQLDAVKFTFV